MISQIYVCVYIYTRNLGPRHWKLLRPLQHSRPCLGRPWFRTSLRSRPRDGAASHQQRSGFLGLGPELIQDQNHRTSVSSLIWNPHIPTLYIRAPARDPPYTKKKQGRAHARGPYFESMNLASRCRGLWG